MKPTKLIGILLFLILTVVANSNSYGFDPSTPTVGERYKVYANLDGSLPSGYDMRISGSSSSSASAIKLGGGTRNWYSYTTASKSGSATVYFKLFKDGVFNRNITSKTLTIKAKITPPTVSSVDVSPTSAYAGTYRDFTARLSGSLPSGYYAKIDIGAGYKSMSCNGSSCSYRRDPDTVGTRRKFTVKVVDSSGSLISARVGYYDVTEKPETQYSPDVSISSASSSATQGQTYQIKLSFSDRNSNLKNAFVNWGDGSSLSTVSLSGGSSTKYVNHTYTKAGNFTWRVEVNDHTGRQNYAQKTVTVKANIPTVSTPSVDKPIGYAGDSFKFTANTSANLPTGYKLYLNFDDSHGSWLSESNAGGHIEMGGSGSSYSLDRVIDTTGDRKFRVGIFNGSNLIGNYSSSNSLTVNAKPETQYSPEVSISSASSSATQGETYQIKLSFSDKNSNLKNAFVNWGDGSSLSTVSLSGGSSTNYVTHTYTKAGNFTWRVEVNDHTGKQDDAQKTVTVKAKVATTGTITGISPTTATKDVRQTFTISGKDFPSTVALSVEGCDTGSVTWISSSSARLSCIPRSTGNKKLLGGMVSGGTRLINTSVYSVNVSSTKTVDSKPTMSISNFPSTVTDTLTTDISYSDDKDLTKVSYKIYNYGQTSGTELKYQLVTLSASNQTSYRKNWDIDVSSLPDGKYEIIFFVSDGITGVQQQIKTFTKESASTSIVEEYGFSPSTVKIGEAFTLSYNTKSALPSNYDIRYSVDGVSGVSKLEGGQQKWYKNSPNGSKIEGVFTFVFKLYKDDKFLKTLESATLTVMKDLNPTEDITEFSEIINYLNQDTLIKKMNLTSSNIKDSPLSRSDAVILIDAMRNLGKSSIKKDMQEYYNPFADVPSDGEYLTSLMRLAYYKSNFGVTTINKTTLFNPMRHTNREEFIKMAINGFDIPIQSYNLSSFDDYVDGKTNMSDWAKKYFETAVYNEIIVGNNNKLLAKDKISIQEALIVLRRIKEKFSTNYSFASSRYETPESLDLSSLYHKNIGFEYVPRYYKPNAKPIDITSISKSKNDNYYVLTVSSTIDSGNGASDYYWWSTDKGYFKEVGSSSNYKTVHFYPMSTVPQSDYHIRVNGGDNLGYVDSYTLVISKDNDFSYPEDDKVASDISSTLNNLTIDNKLIANKLFMIDLTNVSVEKSNIELGVSQVTVSMEYDGKTYQLFHGTPNNKKAQFIVGDYTELYGKTVTLDIEVYSQAKKYTTSKSLTYTPQFTVKGKVYNAVDGEKVTSVQIGRKDVKLDKDGEFYYNLDTDYEIKGLEVKTKENSQENNFETSNIDLNYESPSKYVVLVGEDSRPSLNIYVSPIHVPSNEKVIFTLISDIDIPSNSVIDMEGSSCSSPNGLGTKKVTIECTTPVTSNIIHSIINIKSSNIYADGLIRTVIVDKALNTADPIESVKEQIYIENSTSKDIYLPKEMLGVKIDWSSDNTSLVSNTGKVTPTSNQETVKLTARFEKDGKIETKIFTIPVIPKDTTIIDTDKDGIPDTKDLDIDGDGISNKDEINYGLNPFDFKDAEYDSDGNGISNKDEIKSSIDDTNTSNIDENETTHSIPKETKEESSTITILLKSIDDMSVNTNDTIAPITIDGNASNGESLTYEASSSNTDIVIAEISDTILFLTLVEDAIGEVNITIVANVGETSLSVTFKVKVSTSIEDKVIEETFKTYSIGDTEIVFGKTHHNFLLYSLKKSSKITKIYVKVIGSEVVLDSTYNTTITIPIKDMSILVDSNGNVEPKLAGFLLPKKKLSLGTQAIIEETNATIIVPMPEKLEF